MTVTVGQLTGKTGKAKNCDTWADYEAAGSSTFANLCNGGWFEGDRWEVCRSRTDCRRHTYTRPQEREQDGRRHLSIHEERSNRVRVDRPGTSHPQRERYVDRVEIHTPDEDRPYMDSPRIVHHSDGGHMSPTFLPEDGETFLERLFKNMGQGAINAAFWHGYDLTRHVNVFPHEKRSARRRQHEEDDE